MEQKSCTSSRLCGKVERWKGAKKWRKYSDKVPELTLVACFGLFFNFFFNFVSILFPFVFIFTSPLFSLVTLSPFLADYVAKMSEYESDEIYSPA